jgi:hypothetical protein
MLSPDLFEKWEHLIQGVEKDKIPVEFIKKLIVKLSGRRQRTINIQQMVEQGLDPDEIEEAISSKLDEYDNDIISIEFILDIESIAETVQPATDNLLRGLG